MENQRYKKSNNPGRVTCPIFVFFIFLYSFSFYFAANSNADMLYLKNGDIVEGKILAKDEKNIVLDIFSIKVLKSKGTLIKKILQKKPGRKNQNSPKTKKKFGKVLLKDKTVLTGYLRQTSIGDVLLSGHSYLPDGYQIKAGDIKKVINFQKAVIQRSSKTMAIGFLTKENGKYFYLENIIQPASPGKFPSASISKIKVLDKFSTKPSIKTNEAKITGKLSAKFKLTSILHNANIAVASGYSRSFGSLKAKIPAAIGAYLTFDIGLAGFFSSENNAASLRFWIPGLRLETGYQKFSEDNPLAKENIELTSFLVGSGPIWNIPFFHFNSIKIIFGITAGVSYEKIYFYGQEIASTEFMLASTLGLGYQVGRFNVFTQARFGYSYDADSPLYALGVNLGVGYRL